VHTTQTIGCYSYLAHVTTINVGQHPTPNYGTVIHSRHQAIAGDGPLVASILFGFGHRPSLATNHPGDDRAGRELRDMLNRCAVPLLPGPRAPKATRCNVVVCDHAGNRTWYGDFTGLPAELATIDVEALVSNDVVYIDGYDILGRQPAVIAEAAVQAGRYAVLNLGRSPIPPWLRGFPARVHVLQTNGPEGDTESATAILKELARLDVAELTVVTAGPVTARTPNTAVDTSCGCRRSRSTSYANRKGPARRLPQP
jgi:sugar/nucleoside kinase (ribokinase family)